MRQLVHVNPWLAALLVLFVIVPVLRFSSGCFAVTLTHPCLFIENVVRTDGAWTTPVVVRVVPPTAQDAPQVYGVVCKNRWTLVRIKTSRRIPDESRRHCGLSWPQRWGPHLVAVLGLWLHIGTLQQGVAASTTETKTTPPLEKVPRQARCGELKRSACRLSDRTARPFRSDRSVDITRCGEFHKNSGTDEDGLVVIWQLIPSGPSPFRIALAFRLAQHRPDMAPLQGCRHRSAQRRGSLAAPTSTRPAVGVPVAWPSWCATPCRASACRCWHQLPGDHRPPRVPTGQPQHVRGEPLQPSIGNCSCCSLCEHHSSSLFCSAYCGRPEFTS
ncbi:trans-sialidase [Trypanosoma cruzi]|nr:trans-sialidase [Trypanosoma cruzi]